MVATSGLIAASTRPLAMPITSVAPKSTAKFGAATVARVPPMWPAAAIRSSVPMPTRSHNGPPTRIERPNPQNAAPAIQPTSTLLITNNRSKSPMRSPRIANDIAVATSATQLATKKRRSPERLAPPASRVDEMCVISRFHERFVRAPHVVGNVLVNLEALRRIETYPLQVPDHDANHIVRRQRSVRISCEIIVHGDLRRRHDHVFLGPHLPERRVAAPFHVRLLHDDEFLRVDAALREELLRKRDVLAGVRRTVLDEHAIPRHAHLHRDSRELLRLRLLPQVARNRSEPAREDQERRPASEVQLGAARRDDRVVTAENENGVRRYEPVIQVVIAPDRLGERAYSWVGQSALRGRRTPSHAWRL